MDGHWQHDYAPRFCRRGTSTQRPSAYGGREQCGWHVERERRALQSGRRQMDSHREHALQSHVPRNAAPQRQSACLGRRGSALRFFHRPMELDRIVYYGGGTSSTAVLLPKGDVLMYGNKFSCYAAQFYDTSSNTWSRTQGQCGNNVSFGPLVLLGTGRV